VERRIVVDLDERATHVVGEGAPPAVPEGPGQVEVHVLVRRRRPTRARPDDALVRLRELLVEVLTPQQGGGALLPGIAQERREVALVAPQVAHHRQVGASDQAQGQEAAVEPACAGPRDDVDPRAGSQQVEQLGVDVAPPPVGRRATALHQPVQLDHDAADPDGEAHPAVEDDGDAQVLHVGVVAVGRGRDLAGVPLEQVPGLSRAGGRGTGHGSSSRRWVRVAAVGRPEDPPRSVQRQAPGRIGDAAVTLR
jgi:hypothetical protein